MKTLWWKKSKNKKNIYSFKDAESQMDDSQVGGSKKKPVGEGDSHIGFITSPGSIWMASTSVLHDQLAASCSCLSSRFLLGRHSFTRLWQFLAYKSSVTSCSLMNYIPSDKISLKFLWNFISTRSSSHTPARLVIFYSHSTPYSFLPQNFCV